MTDPLAPDPFTPERVADLVARTRAAEVEVRNQTLLARSRQAATTPSRRAAADVLDGHCDRATAARRHGVTRSALRDALTRERRRRLA